MIPESPDSMTVTVVWSDQLTRNVEQVHYKMPRAWAFSPDYQDDVWTLVKKAAREAQQRCMNTGGK